MGSLISIRESIESSIVWFVAEKYGTDNPVQLGVAGNVHDADTGTYCGHYWTGPPQCYGIGLTSWFRLTFAGSGLGVVSGHQGETYVPLWKVEVLAGGNWVPAEWDPPNATGEQIGVATYYGEVEQGQDNADPELTFGNFWDQPSTATVPYQGTGKRWLPSNSDGPLRVTKFELCTALGYNWDAEEPDSKNVVYDVAPYVHQDDVPEGEYTAVPAERWSAYSYDPANYPVSYFVAEEMQDGDWTISVDTCRFKGGGSGLQYIRADAEEGNYFGLQAVIVHWLISNINTEEPPPNTYDGEPLSIDDAKLSFQYLPWNAPSDDEAYWQDLSPTTLREFTFRAWTTLKFSQKVYAKAIRLKADSSPYTTLVSEFEIYGSYGPETGEEEPPPPEIPNAAVVGIVREPSWASTPVYGDDPDRAIDGILFFPCKQENIQEGIGVLPQVDEFAGRRQLFRIPTSPGVVAGSLEFQTGADLLGYFLTAMFGTPDTDELHDSSGTAEAVYQHTWSPGQLLRTEWPVPYTIESQYTAQPQYASSRSKLLQGAVLHDLELDLPNNAPMIVRAHFVGKRIVWLYPDEDDEHGSGTLDDRGVVRPARMSTIDPTVEEDVWHWSHVAAYPLIDGLPETLITSLSLRPHFSNFAAGFTGGSGSETGTYRADTFVLSGRATILFADETTWLKFVRGLSFSLQAILSASAIQADHSRELVVNAYSCKMDGTQVVNRVGNIEYEFGWTARVDPTEGKACDFVLTNTVSSYAV